VYAIPGLSVDGLGVGLSSCLKFQVLELECFTYDVCVMVEVNVQRETSVKEELEETQRNEIALLRVKRNLLTVYSLTVDEHAVFGRIFEHPRVVLTDKDAKMAATFKGIVWKLPRKFEGHVLTGAET